MEQPTFPQSLEDALIPSLPSSAYYIPNFITPAEEAHLLTKINTAPLPHWTHLSHRRLQPHPSALTPKNTLLASPLPPWLSTPIIPRLLSLPLSASLSANDNNNNNNIFTPSPHSTPNHVLINEYLPGQGILPHEDGPAYHPVVATVSLGSALVLDIYAKPPLDGTREEKPEWRVLQEARSLLVLTGKVYEDCLHGIGEVRVDEGLGPEGIANWALLGDRGEFEGGECRRGTRVSLTYRDVIGVKKLGKGFGFLGR